jgi:hypothetical protein
MVIIIVIVLMITIIITPTFFLFCFFYRVSVIYEFVRVTQVASIYEFGELFFFFLIEHDFNSCQFLPHTVKK